MNGKGVWHLNPPQHHLLHPDRPAAPRQNPLPCLLMGPLLWGLEGWKNEENGGRLGRITNHVHKGSKGRNKGNLKGIILVIGKGRVNNDMAETRGERNQWKKEKHICCAGLA